MPVNLLRIGIALIVWLVFMLAFVAAYWHHWLHATHQISEGNRVFEVKQGESLAGVAFRMRDRGILRWPNVWRRYAKYFDPEPIKVGEYRFQAGESPASILDKLQSGDVITYSVTLLDGKTFADFLLALHSHAKLRGELKGLSVDEQMEQLNLPIEHPEGWFYPDTYQFVLGDTDVGILRRAYAKMSTVLQDEWTGRAADLPYETPYEALIMASIVEKETGVTYERGKIAGVFVRRLLKGMRLQTDPTVIYGLGLSFDGNLTRQHLRTSTPYNTYTSGGLPPTPIAMPGRPAIHAALHPEAGEELYFVAKGDGSHQFSATLEQHNQAVERYQRSRRTKEYRSSPAPAPE